MDERSVDERLARLEERLSRLERRLGAEGRRRYPGPFEEVEPALRQEYARRRGASRLGWDDARPAVRAAWDADRR